MSDADAIELIEARRRAALEVPPEQRPLALRFLLCALAGLLVLEVAVPDLLAWSFGEAPAC